nr:uncharacterized protein LOC129259115 [Lytechinus pictus]
MRKKRSKTRLDSATSSTSGSGSSRYQHLHQGVRGPAKKVIIKKYDETPNRYRSKIDPVNLEEQKIQFLKHGQIPQFQFKVAPEKIEEMSHSKKAEIEFTLMEEATWILEKVRQKYGPGSLFVEQMYGERITAEKANKKLSRYLKQSGFDNQISIGWSKDLACSAKMAWYGPNARANRPEARKYSLWLKDSTENLFLRETGIICLADHEIGTHFLRTVNDGIQPWFSNREQFGLKKFSSHLLLETEEGLATINTLIQANKKFLWFPAILYYTACKAATMTFEELFAHLGHYIENRELRWRYVMRVKRSLPDPAGVGGYGNDQCYFKGAAEILRSINTIDFHLLYAGKVCLESLPRIQRMARLDCIRIPHFMHDICSYLRTLRTIAATNGLNLPQKPSVIPKEVSLRRKPKKTKSGGGKKRRNSSKAKVDKAPKPQQSSSDEILIVQNDILDCDEQVDLIFQRTYDQSAMLKFSPSLEAIHDQGTSLVTGSGNTSPRESREAWARKCLSKSYIYAYDDDHGASSEQSVLSVSYGENDPSIASGLRCQSQPTIMNIYEDSLRTDQSQPLGTSNRGINRLSPLSGTPSKQNGLNHNSSSQTKVKRPVSPLGAGMPNVMPTVSSRYRREKCASPVPFSSHRWLLLRRDKCPPNSIH